mmetsp:Transcript_21602/g.40458  ORF Transcript_21602/g.40458 Transcript_21602/m.40458 type:complete len:85 (-) Transcript_21602:300-554(-)
MRITHFPALFLIRLTFRFILRRRFLSHFIRMPPRNASGAQLRCIPSSIMGTGVVNDKLSSTAPMSAPGYDPGRFLDAAKSRIFF